MLSIRKFPTIATALLAGGLILNAGATLAQEQKRPPPPDLSVVSSTLDVPQNVLRTCLGEPPAADDHPQPPDMAALSDCLNKSGHTVSASDVEAAFRAAVPPRQ
ncbi:hypothetical protein [Falsirhodobacter sp. alg1]|uniref:hypothetical protein n=1 Tax=Falsirhodobacter sp. alg1 TaxID=1472418 RepID=UPI0005F0ACEC|nr:hypothetical protein [Falsirhodobacter sp. alg1]